MKRYEKMTAKEIMDAYNFESMAECNAKCKGCIVKDWDDKHHFNRCTNSAKSCTEIVRAFLNEEIETKSLWQTFKSDEELKNCFRQWIDDGQKDISAWAFINYLCTNVEVTK